MLPTSRKRRLIEIVLSVVREPMFLLLVVCGVIYFMIGDRQEAIILLGFVVMVAAITLYQEQKTERALEALRDLSSPRALVMRGGQRRRIAGAEVVRGDLLILAEGDRVAADAGLVSCSGLSTDESLLTGESLPTIKTIWDGQAAIARPGKDAQSFVYAGTLVTHGQATAEVLAIGVATEMGRIGKALLTVKPERSQLQRETDRLVRLLAVVALALCVLVAVVYGAWHSQWLEGLLAGLTLAMAVLPNELPAILAIFLAMGAWRLSQKRALVRRTPAMETLGSTTVLCVDKTGTLTLNQMAVSQLIAAPDHQEDEVLEVGALASQRDPFDPMDRAIKALAAERLGQSDRLHPEWSLTKYYPLSDALLAVTQVWSATGSAAKVVASKGAFEAIARLCRLEADELTRWSQVSEQMAATGLRVLGVARGSFEGDALPSDVRELRFDMVGLVGFADPLRPSVPAALAECVSAGIRVVMITGDHPQTARKIAEQAGIQKASEVLTGAELAQLNDEALKERVAHVNVFARVVPEQKLRLVQALKSRGEVVAMTGDGVNDAPALKAADIGIAMGGRGTDVAREASALVILDDDFATIVQAIRLGRRVFDNLKGALAYVLAVHVPIAGMTVFPVLLGLPLVLMPVHVAFLHLIIEPACSVVFEVEPEAAGIMQRPPRDPRARLYSRRFVGLSVLQGASVLALLMAVFVVTLRLGRGELEARGMAFTTLVIANLALILVNRSWTLPLLRTLRTPNRALWWVLGGGMALLVLALYVPFLRSLLRVSILHWQDWLICLGVAVVSIAWFEVLKMARGSHASHKAKRVGVLSSKESV